jgi:hypothetical protein
MHRHTWTRHAAALLAAAAAVILLPAAASAQLTVQDQNTPGVTPESIAQSLAGAGVSISNVTYAGTLESSGLFQGGQTIIGFEEGAILSSGWASDVPGPNVDDALSRFLDTGGDPDLDDLSGFETFDKTVLEFDLVPQADTLTFDYVFGSQEYNEYVNTQFNDVFAFFVNDGTGTVNCATVPVTGEPVSINTINGGNPFGTPPMSHPELYRNNDPNDPGATINTEADGLTVVLTCTASVTPGATNHIKLAIADASDTALDSYVFLRANSFVSSNITLEPLTATNPTGSEHTVTATVTENGQPVEGAEVTFDVLSGPHAGTGGVDLTDANGQATFTYLGLFEGTDTLQASYEFQKQTQESNTVEKIWVDLGATTLELEPRTAVNPVGTSHCVVATALDAASNPKADITVYFTVTGSVAASGSETTDANGQAQFCYTGPVFPGADDIFAFADNNNNGRQDPTEPSDTAEKTWVFPQSTAGCKITYGGHITASNGDPASFGGNAKAPNKGNNNYQDHGPAQQMHVKMPTVIAVLCSDDDTHGTIYAKTSNGVNARIDVQDLGEPGRNDTYRLQLESGYDTGEQTLENGGNIQIHH